MELSEEDKALIRDHLDRGEPLPDRFRFTLFREPREAELIWPGKTSEVTNVVLPFQSIEQIDEPRAESGAQVADLFQMGSGGRQTGGWSNKLIWGDNKLVLSSLKGGPLSRQAYHARRDHRRSDGPGGGSAGRHLDGCGGARSADLVPFDRQLQIPPHGGAGRCFGTAHDGEARRRQDLEIPRVGDGR